MKKIKAKLSWVVIVVVAIGFMIGCTHTQKDQDEQAYTMMDLNEQLVMATLWIQTSAEVRALSYQAYNLARMNLDSFLASYSGSKPVAVIVDIDETVLDNFDYEAWLIGNNFGYSSKTWGPWIAEAKAKAVPGSVEFLNYAKQKGVETFYISSRKMAWYDGTEKNLKALGFPYADKKHLMLKTKTSNKQPRRDMVAKDYEIALLLGDNLNDFLNVFAKKSVAERFAETDKIKDEWGKKFIVFPNPVYGEWEWAIQNYNFKASAAEKDQMRKDHLRRWNYKP